jgi:hypothetical protein
VERALRRPAAVATRELSFAATPYGTGTLVRRSVRVLGLGAATSTVGAV